MIFKKYWIFAIQLATVQFLTISIVLYFLRLSNMIGINFIPRIEITIIATILLVIFAVLISSAIPAAVISYYYAKKFKQPENNKKVALISACSIGVLIWLFEVIKTNEYFKNIISLIYSGRIILYILIYFIIILFFYFTNLYFLNVGKNIYLKRNKTIQ